MMKVNNEMMKYILSIKNNDNMVDEKVKEFTEIVFSKIKLIDDLIVVVDIEHSMEQEKLDYDSILEQYGDYTGFEASCNEMRVMDYIDLSNVNLAIFLLRLVDELKIYLNEMFPKYSFVIIGAINKGQINLRFHMLRQNEIGWISDDLDEFNEAILVNTVNCIM